MNLWRPSFLVCALLSLSAEAQTTLKAEDAFARDIFKELIEINTTDSVGSVTAASEAMAARLRQAGFTDADMQLLGPNDRKRNLVVRFRGTGKHKPALLFGHLDVVEARREDWTTDPFKFVEKDGYFYGRGTQDMKSGDAIMVSALARLKKEKFKPSRDIILILTADEEGGKSNGVDWLFKNHRDLVDAEFAINHDGWSVISSNGTPQFFDLTATEKVYADFQLTVTNKGGHSSEPTPDNAIYQLVAGLARLQKYEFPFELNAVTRPYYEKMATIETGERAADMRAILADPPDMAAVARLSKDPLDHSTLHTTCVPTRLEGGHANNALPQLALANVNCRIEPGHPLEDIRHEIIKVLDDPGITVRFVADNFEISDKAPDRKAYAPAPLNPVVIKPLEKIVEQFWPGLKVVPSQSSGATDGVYVNAAGIPTFVIAGIDVDRADVRAHGRDERVGVQSFYRGNEFFYQYLKAMAAR
jgi:acetylornithine deacetylase/succinyl-diaminopimelate desuccinylase-like protein